MSFTFSTTVPAAPNNPSVDQPDMLQNNVATSGIVAVDHITFNALGGGQHKQVTFNSKNVPAAQTDPQSVLYTDNVIATATNTASASTVASLFYRNQNSGPGPANNAFPISMLRAFGCFDGGGNPLNTWNMSITLPAGHTPGSGVYTIDLPANIVTGTSYLVIPSTGINGVNPGRGAMYAIASATQFVLGFRNFSNNVLADPDQFSVLILQL